MNQFEMFKVLLEYTDKSEDPDCFDDLVLEWNEIMEKTKEWKYKVEKTYNAMKKEGLIK